MEPKNEDQKSSNIYHCNYCYYTTSRKSQYTRHLLTNKHIILTNPNKKVPSNVYACECGKKYKHQSTLCAHKKHNCKYITLPQNDPENITMSIEEEEETEKKVLDSNIFSFEMITEMLKQNQEFKELIIEHSKQVHDLNKQILEISKDRSVTNNNNNITQNNNNKFNLNVFLNETCKDALNMSEFLESLTLCLNDFENFGPLGYCGGITNILLKGLNTLDVNKRPIHCSDLKREVIHIKNNDVWQKDEEQAQMIKAIKAIEHKNMKQMSLWAKANPEYKDANHKKSDLYTKLMDNSLGETDKEKAQKNYHKIIRSVAKEILVEK